MESSITNQKGILVIDDEEHIRKLLQRVLEEAGYGTVTAATGREALDKLSLGNVSLVLLDIRMPELDGFQTLDLIREQSNIPVIMLTVKKETKLIMDAQSLGASDYIPKPFLFKDLFKAIKRQI